MIKTDPQTIETLMTRGVVDVIVKEDLRVKLESGKQLRVKLGIDPTGKDLHIGHAVVLRKLKHFQEAGHQVVLVIGTFTARIGDPSGKSKGRDMLTMEQIQENLKLWFDQARKVIDTERIEIRYNHEWLAPLTFEELIHLCSQFTMQQMIQRDMFQERLKNDIPIGLHEFLYPLMQGYDSVALKADVEIGGTDQLFNLLAGRPLQKAFDQQPQNILTVPILEGLDGHEKMSKSLGNYIGITDKPEDMYGKTMSIPDTLILKYFELATDVSIEDIKDIKKELEAGENPRNVKMRLAREIVRLYHSESAAQEAEQHFITVFQKKDIPDEIPEVPVASGEQLLVDLVAELKLTPSKTETRNMIRGGGVKLDSEKVEDINLRLAVSQPVVLQLGKRTMVRLVPKS